MSAVENAQRVNAAIDAVQAIVATVLNVDAEQIIEYQESNEVPGVRGYVSCEAQNIAPGTVCTMRIPLVFTIGFQIAEDGAKPRRVQRLETQFALTEGLTARGAIPQAGLVLINDMSVSIAGDPPPGYLWGGLTLTCYIDVARG